MTGDVLVKSFYLFVFKLQLYYNYIDYTDRIVINYNSFHCKVNSMSKTDQNYLQRAKCRKLKFNLCYLVNFRTRSYYLNKSTQRLTFNNLSHEYKAQSICAIQFYRANYIPFGPPNQRGNWHGIITMKAGRHHGAMRAVGLVS